jgi:hypothetical protein
MPKLIHTYRGVNIYRQLEPGHKLRWYSIVPNLAADTLDGIKQLIREHVDA